ncbi:MAG TPA: oxidoreductase [Steroidobacteraceae bacterium]|nr:oxidoreductase [Steroidobacteraceae bacterium]
MSSSKVVLVTGASSGIGRATAEYLARRGHRVYGTARSPEHMTGMQDAKVLSLDITQAASVLRAVQAVLSEAGRIDVLVNNAGAALIGAFEETSIEQAQALFDVNFFGVMRVSQAVLPAMRAQRSGLIVNVSSVLGFLPGPYFALYASTKHALEGLSESLDHEVRQFGIRVALIEPAFTRTGLGAHSVSAGPVLHDYDSERSRAVAAIAATIQSAPLPLTVAEEICRAIEGPHRLRRPVAGQARLLSRLRRLMPAGLVDRQLRKSFGLG